MRSPASPAARPRGSAEPGTDFARGPRACAAGTDPPGARLPAPDAAHAPSALCPRRAPPVPWRPRRRCPRTRCQPQRPARWPARRTRWPARRTQWPQSRGPRELGRAAPESRTLARPPEEPPPAAHAGRGETPKPAAFPRPSAHPEILHEMRHDHRAAAAPGSASAPARRCVNTDRPPRRPRLLPPPPSSQRPPAPSRAHAPPSGCRRRGPSAWTPLLECACAQSGWVRSFAGNGSEVSLQQSPGLAGAAEGREKSR